MKASLGWGALLFLGWVGQGAAEELDYQLQPRQVAPDTYVVEGALEHFSFKNGGNIANAAFIVTEAGVVVIDTGPSRLYGEQLRAAIAKITEKPVVRVYITHHHPDHMFGNQAFQDIAIYALPETTRAAAAETPGFADNMYRLAGDWMRGTEVVLPSHAVEPGISEIGGHRLELTALQGHTVADLVIYDHETGVLFSGQVFNQRTPATPSSDIEAWLASLRKLQDYPIRVLVPAVGPPATGPGPGIVQENIDYLLWLRSSLQQAAQQGLSMAEALELPIPARFAEQQVLRGEYMRSVAHLYPALQRQALGVETSE